MAGLWGPQLPFEPVLSAPFLVEEQSQGVAVGVVPLM